jgi:hypothetical protein
MKLFGLYFHIQRGTPYFIRPEGGGWQLHLGFMTITREIPKIQLPS